MDTFIEYMVKRKKGNKEFLITILIVFVAIAISYFITLPLLFSTFSYASAAAQILSSLAFALFVAFWYIAFRLIQGQNVEYEYAFTSGELDIDKVIARRKRKRLLSVSVRNFGKFAPLSTQYYNDFYRSLPTIDASTGTGENTYFVVFNKDGEKKCLLFNPPKRMIDAIKPFCSSGVAIDK